MSRAGSLPTPDQALPGRDTAMPVPGRHLVSGQPLQPPFPDTLQRALFGMGCFWGAERLFWQQPGVWSTAAGYAGGHTPNPAYDEVCSGQTGHCEVVQVIFDPQQTDYWQLLQLFWANHDPTQGMRQGNDQGTQYRSALYCTSPLQLQLARHSCEQFQKALRRAGFGQITTEMRLAPALYYAEAWHQQYLARNPDGYCGLRGTGVCLPGQ